MDVWPPEPAPQRHKRSFAEMSQSATLSPSPMNFGDLTSNFLSSSHYLPAPNDNSQPSFLDRRRTSHPHNPPLHRTPESMPERSQSQLRPRVENQASIIDLTDESEERHVASRNRDRSHSHRPPQLGRSDAVGFADFIDLTEDVEPDLIITGVQELPRPNLGRNDTPARQRRDESPSLFMPIQQPHQRHVHRVFAAHPNVLGALGVFGARMDGSNVGMAPILGRMAHEFIDHVNVHLYHPPQPMPGHMDYQNNAFAQRKAEHVAPPPARPDFTRSPKEDDIIICPSCEQELVHRKDGGEPVAKKGGKAPTRKEREEHPFWVVKECGHVYCNNCYQNRIPSSKVSTAASFPEIPKTGKGRPTKVLGCAVEGCESEVKSKDKWVGVFL